MLKRVVHPGSILRDELEELGVAPAEFARRVDMPAGRVDAILDGARPVDADTAPRLGHWFGVDPQFWLNLRAQFDLARADTETGGAIRRLPTRADLPPRAAPLGAARAAPASEA